MIIIKEPLGNQCPLFRFQIQFANDKLSRINRIIATSVQQIVVHHHRFAEINMGQIAV